MQIIQILLSAIQLRSP